MDQEQKWIRRIQRRSSEKDADALIRKYYSEIFAYAYKQVSDRETALDLTQEIFIAVLRSLHTYDSGRATFRTGLQPIKLLTTAAAVCRLLSRLTDCSCPTSRTLQDRWSGRAF